MVDSGTADRGGQGSGDDELIRRVTGVPTLCCACSEAWHEARNWACKALGCICPAGTRS